MELTTELLRKQLASIDLSSVEEKQMTESERKEYCAAICAVFPRLEKDLKELMHAQLLYSSNEAETWERVIFARGTFNGLKLAYELWQKANTEHLERIPQNDDKFEKYSPIGEMG